MNKRKIKPVPGDNKKNKGFFPLPLRCLIVGTSGCGKTTLLYNLITEEWGLPFYHLYIFSKSMDQKPYQSLKKIYEKLSNKEGEEIAYFFNSCEEIIPVDECEPGSLIIFDDCINIQQQHIIKDYFVRGRPKNISCIYLAQSYYAVDKQLIRNNINFLCIFRQSSRYLKDIYNEYVGTDFSFGRFKEICNLCWNNDAHGFLTIDITKKLNDGRYRQSFMDEPFND